MRHACSHRPRQPRVCLLANFICDQTQQLTLVELEKGRIIDAGHYQAFRMTFLRADRNSDARERIRLCGKLQTHLIRFFRFGQPILRP